MDFNALPPEDKLHSLVQSPKTASPALAEIAKLLFAMKSLPNISINPQSMRRNANYDVATSTVNLDPGRRGLNPNTAAHEMTHALEFPMYREAQSAPLSSQFRQGYDKFSPAPNLPMPASPYRSDPLELRAHGVGKYADPEWADMGQPAPPHMDATNATEMAILRDLLARHLQGRK